MYAKSIHIDTKETNKIYVKNLTEKWKIKIRQIVPNTVKSRGNCF